MNEEREDIIGFIDNYPKA